MYYLKQTKIWYQHVVFKVKLHYLSSPYKNTEFLNLSFASSYVFSWL